jgi:hypothetical protein
MLTIEEIREAFKAVLITLLKDLFIKVSLFSIGCQKWRKVLQEFRY